MKKLFFILCTFIFCARVNSQVIPETIDLRPFGLEYSVLTTDISESSNFWEGIQLCQSLDMEVPKAIEIFQIWCHADLPSSVKKSIRRECQKVGTSNTVPNFKFESENPLDYWSSNPDDIARDWARGVDFKKGVYYMINGHYLAHIRCIKRTTQWNGIN